MIERLFSYGLKRLFGGLREGRPGLAGASAAIALITWLRRRRRPAKERIYGINLKEGEAVKIRFVKAGTVVDEAEVAG